MPIQHERIKHDIAAIATCTATPSAGASRPTFSESWRAACDYVTRELERCNCQIRVDAAGNIHARPRGLSWDEPAWMSGSHLDSVPNGGDFDGVAGVVVPLELLRAAHEDGRDDLPLELVVFTEEEGTTFGLGMLGSRAFVGTLSSEDLAQLRNREGETYLHAGWPHGVRAEVIGRQLLRPETTHGFVEVHVSQGPRLWNEGKRVAVVDTVAGRRQYRCRVIGRANHAGSTAMVDRQDALAATADIILQLEALAKELPFRSVITVGRLFSRPNAINVITGQADLTIDFRSPDNDVLADGDARIRALIGEIRLRRGVRASLEMTESHPAEKFDAGVCDALVAASKKVGFSDIPVTVSGALHDAAILSPYVPTAMLFIASRDGISHNPDEFSRTEDVAAAAEIIWEMINANGSEIGVSGNGEGERDNSPISIHELNRFDQEKFVAVVGPAFEHSPWIAERTWARRPFGGIEELLRALVATVEAADRREKIALIRAHPDLVGQAARNGTLTPDSTLEQAEAGLGDLSSEEVTLFDKYNEAYRQRFGFPFVICARENKKESILAAFPRRLEHSQEAEIDSALAEIAKIARFRLKERITEGP